MRTTPRLPVFHLPLLDLPDPLSAAQRDVDDTTIENILAKLPAHEVQRFEVCAYQHWHEVRVYKGLTTGGR
jgi:hypothetical protein